MKAFGGLEVRFGLAFLVGGSEGTRVQHPTTTTTKQKHTSEKEVFVLRSTGGPQNFEKFEDGHFDMSKECSVGASMPDYTNFPENALNYVRQMRSASIISLRKACSGRGISTNTHREEMIYNLVKHIFKL